MRYRLTSPGAYPITGSSPGETRPVQSYMGRYFSPGEVPYDGTFRLKGLGDTTDSSGTTDSSTSSTPSWLQNLVTGATQFVEGQQQMSAIAQVNQINIQRAAAGLPPISVPTLGAPSVNVGLSPDVQALLLYGGLAFAGVWLFTSFMKHRA